MNCLKFSIRTDLITLNSFGKTWYKFLFSDNEYLNYGGTLDETLDEIKEFPEDVEGYKNY